MGLLVTRERVGAEYSLHSGAALTPELEVGRFNGA
jgi:hypothetical protein